MAKAGHTVGNHTYHHYDMSKIADKATFTEELRSLEQLYEETTGQQLSKFYRPPQGVYSQENLQMAQELGYHTVFWSLAYMDWVNDKQPTADAAFSKLIPRIHNGAIVLPAQYLPDQCGDPGSAAHPLGRAGLPVRNAGGALCRVQQRRRTKMPVRHNMK